MINGNYSPFRMRTLIGHIIFGGLTIDYEDNNINDANAVVIRRPGQYYDI